MAPVYYPRALVVLEVLLEDFQGGLDDKVHRYEAVPRRAEVERNTLREADVFRFELDYADLPIDPRSLRQVHVAIYMADVGDPDRELSVADYDDVQFIGYADEDRIRLDDSGEIVEIDGRDYTALFLDYIWPANKTINVARPLEVVIDEVVRQVPGAARLPIEWVGDAASARGLKLSDKVGRTIWTPKGKTDDAWTLLCDLLEPLGLLPVVRLDTLEIRAPGEFAAQASVFIYGQNVRKLEMKRKFNDLRSRQIRVVQFDPQSRSTTEATYPAKPIVLKKTIGTDGKVTADAAPVLTFAVSGSLSQTELKTKAQRIYDEWAREQVEGVLETKEMTSLARDALVRLANGDRLTVMLWRGDQARIVGLSDADARRVLTTGPRPLKAEVADALLAARRRAETLATTFYVRVARHTWTRDDGYALSVDFINFVAGDGS